MSTVGRVTDSKVGCCLEVWTRMVFAFAKLKTIVFSADYPPPQVSLLPQLRVYPLRGMSIKRRQLNHHRGDVAKLYRMF